MTDWVFVGAEVTERRSGWGQNYTYGPVQKIAKVYKNGNFLLEGDDQQWRPSADLARKTGDQGFYSHRTTIVPFTDAVKADMVQAQKYEAAKTVVRIEAERLEKIWRSGDVDTIIAEAEKLKAATNA